METERKTRTVLAANYHTHTLFCDGKDTAEDMVKAAIRLGFRHLGFSGHMDSDIRMDLPAYIAEIRRLQAAYRDQIEILCGMELDTLYDPSVAKGLDYVIGSTHFLGLPAEKPLAIDTSEEQSARLCNEYFGGDWYAMAKAYYDIEATVYDRTHCTFAGHFDLITRFNDSMHTLDENDPRYLKPAMDAMAHLVSQGVPFEINCGAINRNRKAEPYPNFRLLRHLHDLGGEIFINADAHQKELLDGGFPAAVEAAIAAGFRSVHYLTRDQAGKTVIRQWSLV